MAVTDLQIRGMVILTVEKLLGVVEMAQCIKCLLYKNGDPSSVPGPIFLFLNNK